MCNNSDVNQVQRDLGVGPSTADYGTDYVV